MKKKFTKLMAALALLVFMAPSMVTWGQTRTEVTYTFSEHYSANTTLTDVVIAFDSYITGTFSKGTGSTAPQYYTNGTAVRWYGGNTLVINASNATITQIEFNYSQKNKAVTADDGDFDDANGIWTGTSSSVTFTVESGSGHNRVTAIKVTYTPAGGTLTPSISANNVEIAYNATSGSIDYNINNPVNGGSLSAEVTTGDWITLGSNNGEQIAFTCSANPTAASRDAEVTLTYTYSSNQTVTKKVTVTQNGDPNLTMTIAEVRAQGTGSVVTSGTVTSCVGTTGYIQDATAAICVYGTALTVGDNITVQGTLSTYNGLLEITSPTVTVISSGNTIAPEVMTIAEINASTNQGWFIRIENATVTAISGSGNQQNTTIAQGENSVVVRGNLGTTVAVNDVIASLDGNIGAFNGVQIANPQNVSVQQNLTPSISADNVNIASDATGGALEYTINNPVTGGTLTAEAAATSSWLNNVQVDETNNQVTFNCDPNTETTPRVTTVTLTYTYGSASVNKEVTVTQAAHENPAALFYTWNLSTNSYASASPEQVSWTSDYATMVVDKANAGTNANNYLGGSQTSTRFYKNSVLTIAPVAGYAITSVVFTATTTGYATALTNSTWTNAAASVNDVTVTITPTNGTTEMSAVIGGTCGFTAVTVYYEQDNSPAISANDVSITYDATSGSIVYSLTNAVSGGVMTASVPSGSWISLGTNFTSPIAFTCDVNPTANPRTTTVTLTYTYNRATVTKDVVVTQDGNSTLTMTIAEVRAQGTGDVLTVGIVTSISGSSNKTAYIQDATAAIVVFGNFTAAVGDEITVSGTLSDYNGLLEITNPTVTVVSSGNIVSPQLMTIDEINSSTNQGWYIRIENAIVTNISGSGNSQNTTIAQGSSSIVVRGNLGVTVAVDDVITSLDGNIGCYNQAAQIANPQNVSVQQNPSITADNVSIDYDATEGTISYTINNPASNGVLTAEVTTGDWLNNIQVNETNNTVTFNCDPNQTTSPRNATVTLTYTFGSSSVTKDVTVTQAAYVAPFTPTNFTLATTIESGRRYIVVGLNGEEAYAMGAQGNNNRTAIGVEKLANGGLLVNSADVAELVINGPDTAGYYTIYDANYIATNFNGGYLYAASSSANHLKTRQFNTDGNSRWTIEFDTEDNAVITAKGDHSRNLMRFNTSGLFSCYSSGQQPVFLYVKDEVDPQYTFYKDINGYNGNAGGYYLISSPIEDLDPVNVSGLLTPPYDLYWFDQTAVNEEWQNYKAGSFNFSWGLGYLYAHYSDITLAFSGDAPSPIGEIPLVYDNTVPSAGINLVGNPFGRSAWVDKDFFVLDENGAELIASQSRKVNCMEGIFVIAQSDGEEVTFSTTAPSAGNKLVLNINQQNEQVIDRAIVNLGEGGTLPKFMLNPNNTKIYIPKNDQEYAVVSSHSNVIPVNFKAAENGTFTLNLQVENAELDYLHLFDNKTGADIDLLVNPSYSFEANTTDLANRFSLVFSTQGNNEVNADDSFAFINNGQIVIPGINDNATLQIVDVTGRIIVSKAGSCTVSTETMTPGVYVLRLIQGENVKIQKIVVR